MSDPIRYASIRDAIFEHDMFDAAGSGVLYTLEGIRQVEATWAFESTELAAELMRMTDDGLVVPTYGETWNATPAGRIAREARWQPRGLRHPTLTLQTAMPEDLVIALIATTTDGWDVLSNAGFVEAALGVYLFRLGDAVCDATVTTLISRGLVRRELPDGFGWQATLMLTADGRRLYAQRWCPGSVSNRRCRFSQPARPSTYHSKISA
ncbi:hypothetical protein [Paraburkholderia nemoris]|uniref:hypothetical protein n=1 Tax=Paraburkholderia nemoris TaxID=2793076 RepID=UPI0038B77FB8